MDTLRTRASSKSQRQSRRRPSSQEGQPPLHPVVPLILLLLLIAGSVSLVFASRLSINVKDEGWGQATGAYFPAYTDFNGLTADSNGRFTLFKELGSGTGLFSLKASIFYFGSVNLDANMDTTFRFIFSQPTPPLPQGTSLPQSIGFISFVEAWGDAQVSAAGEGIASSWVTSNPNLAGASVYAAAQNGFDHRTDPTSGWRRGTAVKSVDLAYPDIVSPNVYYGDYKVNISGNAFAYASDSVSIARANARTGIVYLIEPDPLGVPEVGDNEYVYSEVYVNSEVWGSAL